MTTKCLTKVNTMINAIQTSALTQFKQSDKQTIMTQKEVDQCLVELLYIKRYIDTQAMFVDAEKPLEIMESTILKYPENQIDLTIIKYYVKSLLRYDEFQLGVEAKTGY